MARGHEAGRSGQGHSLRPCGTSPASPAWRGGYPELTDAPHSDRRRAGEGHRRKPVLIATATSRKLVKYRPTRPSPAQQPIQGGGSAVYSVEEPSPTRRGRANPGEHHSLTRRAVPATWPCCVGLGRCCVVSARTRVLPFNRGASSVYAKITVVRRPQGAIRRIAANHGVPSGIAGQPTCVRFRGNGRGNPASRSKHGPPLVSSLSWPSRGIRFPSSRTRK